MDEGIQLCVGKGKTSLLKLTHIVPLASSVPEAKLSLSYLYSRSLNRSTNSPGQGSVPLVSLLASMAK